MFFELKERERDFAFETQTHTHVLVFISVSATVSVLVSVSFDFEKYPISYLTLGFFKNHLTLTPKPKDKDLIMGPR